MPAAHVITTGDILGAEPAFANNKCYPWSDELNHQEHFCSTALSCGTGIG